MGSTTETKIRSIFDDLSGGQVERVKKAKDYAFVHFSTRDAAEKALAGVKVTYGKDLLLDDANVEVTWSKPVDKHIYNQRKQLTKVLTTPVPCPPGYSGFSTMEDSPIYYTGP